MPADATGEGATTLAQLLARSIATFAQRIAFAAPDRPDLTYAALGRQLDATARALNGAGYGRGSRIAIALPAGPEFAVAVLAVCSVATGAPLNHGLGETALADLLTAMRIEALVVSDGTDPAALRAAAGAGVALLRLRFSPREGAGTFELADLPGRERHAAAPMPDDVALLTHTSGTTSAPKIVPLEQWRMAEAARSRARLGELRSTDRSLLLTPLYSIAGIYRGMLGLLVAGGSVVCATAVDGRTVVDLLEAMAPTLYSAPPAVQLALLEEFERRSPRPRHSLRLVFSSQAELRAPLKRRLEETFHVPVIRAYGMTEAGNIAQAPLPPEQAPPGSVGRPSGLQIAVADEAGRLLGAEAEGEILVRGPEVFGGYENDDEANRAAFIDGWFRTGDRGRVDRDGFVYLGGRIKDMINRGGTKIAPREVEAALQQHPGVAEAAAFAVPHPTLGEDVAAAVIVHPEHKVTGAELRRYARSRLMLSKAPARVFVVAELPRGSFGKVDRRALAEMALSMAQPGTDAPADEGEAEVARIFGEVLGLPALGRADGFFDLGGDSLRGVRVLALVEERFGVAVTLDVLIDHPGVADFAAALRASRLEADGIGAGNGLGGRRLPAGH